MREPQLFFSCIFCLSLSLKLNFSSGLKGKAGRSGLIKTLQWKDDVSNFTM